MIDKMKLEMETTGRLNYFTKWLGAKWGWESDRVKSKSGIQFGTC